MKRFIFALSTFLILLVSIESANAAGTKSASKADPCAKNWVFFDLGDTLVDSKAGKNHLMTYLPGAVNYLKNLKDQGYQMGLISNIPDDWGVSPATRLVRLKKEIADSWNPADKEGFHWEWFNEDAIFLPAQASERKPAPILFHRAISFAQKASGCKRPVPYFQSESPDEIAAANQTGMQGFLVVPAAPGKDTVYAPVSQSIK